MARKKNTAGKISVIKVGKVEGEGQLQTELTRGSGRQLLTP